MKQLGILMVFLFMTTAGFAQAPTVGAVANAGSNVIAGLPNAPLAQGSMFVLFGANLGPATLQSASSYPLQTALGGTSINITVSGTTTQALMVYTSAGQVAAILPSRTPVGTGTLTVSFNGQTSAAFSIQVVQNNFGIFTLNSQGSGAAIVLDGSFQLITALKPATPNQTVAVWGTGLGPITGDETGPPAQTDMTNVAVEVYVGTAKATVVYRGRTSYPGIDQVNFTIPSGQLGCNVSVVVKIGSLVSNSTTIALANSNSTPCSDPNGLSATALEQLSSRGNIAIGNVVLSKNTTQLDISTSLPPGVTLPPGFTLPGSSTTTETGGATFARYNRDAFLASAGSFSSVSVGGCAVSTFHGQSAAAALGNFTVLDAGSSIGVTGPNGNRQLNKSAQTVGIYFAQLSDINQPGYLVPGSYSVNGPGGADVGAFQTSITASSSLNWLNQSSISTVNRSQDLNISWSGAGNGQVLITGTSVTGSATATIGATFVCLAPAAAGQFTVPAAVLLALPPSSSAGTGGVSVPTGFLFVGTSTTTPFTAPGLDQGFAVYSDSTGKGVTFQ